MISGTYVLTDQIDSGFAHLHDAYKGTDVPSTRKAVVHQQQMAARPRACRRPWSTQVHAVHGVAKAAGYVDGMGAAAVDGKVVETGGAPTLFFSTRPATIAQPQLHPGTPSPDASPGEVVASSRARRRQAAQAAASPSP